MDATPTEAELEILQFLWKHAPATVRQVHEALAQTKQVGYTTTLKQMQRMTEKGFIAQHKTGKSHEYTAILQESAVQGSLLQHLVEIAFKGSTTDLLLRALGDDAPGEEELAALEAWLAAQKNK
jgi:predicted transcriptional regulator